MVRGLAIVLGIGSSTSMPSGRGRVLGSCWLLAGLFVLGCDSSQVVDDTPVPPGPDLFTYYFDYDGDGYGQDDITVETLSDEPPFGYARQAGDCDDLDAENFPTNVEAPDFADNDCDGEIDNGYTDFDEDGSYGEVDDCDDQDPDISPAAIERLDGIDNDCDDQVDDDPLPYWTVFATRDGYTGAILNGGLEDDGRHIPDRLERADYLCTQAALAEDSVVPPGDYVAWISDSTRDAVVRIAGDGTFVNAGGELLAVDRASLVTPPYLLSGITYMENGAEVGAVKRFWTGTDRHGEATLPNCADWTTVTGQDGAAGHVFESGTEWSEYGNSRDCLRITKLVCIQQSVYTDADNDGYFAETDDCDDTDEALNPGATEVYDGVDNDCDGTVDNDGRAERVVFVTSAETTGDLRQHDPIDGSDAMRGANQFCQDLAESPGSSVPKNYRYVAAVTEGGSMVSRLPVNARFLNAAGELLAHNRTSLFSDVDVANAVMYDEQGNVHAGNGTPWSSCDPGSSGCPMALDNCANWTSSAGDEYGLTGAADEAGVPWRNTDFLSACSVPQSLYCVQQDATSNADADGDGVFAVAGDCNDHDAKTYPGAPELPDGLDNDCDGDVDEGLYFIGDIGPGGGLVFSVTKNHRHGMEAGLPILDGGIVWGCMDERALPTGTNDNGYGQGQNNTRMVEEAGCATDMQTAFTAVHEYRSVLAPAVDDWFLPSLGELLVLLFSRTTAMRAVYPDLWYWSSTEDSATRARSLLFHNEEPVIQGNILLNYDTWSEYKDRDEHLTRVCVDPTLLTCPMHTNHVIPVRKF